MNDLQHRIALAEQQVARRKLEINRCYAEFESSMGKRFALSKTLIFTLAWGWTLRLLTRKHTTARRGGPPSFFSRMLGLLGSLLIPLLQFLPGRKLEAPPRYSGR